MTARELIDILRWVHPDTPVCVYEKDVYEEVEVALPITPRIYFPVDALIAQGQVVALRKVHLE